MKLSRTVIYAVQATLQLAQADPKCPVPCSRLAAAGQMPERFLLQILRSLVTHGILHSTRGVEGGYSLGRKPCDISLLDVIEAIEGPVSSALPGDGGVPPESRARLTAALDQITESVRQQLSAITLSQLLPNAASPSGGGVLVES